MWVLGVDPGNKGGLAVVHFGEGREPEVVSSTRAFSVKSKGRGEELSAEMTAEWLVKWAPLLNVGVVERVASRPHDGGASSFKFGKGAGIYVGALAALGVRRIEPTPAQWKRDMRLGSDKSQSLAEAARLHPDMAKLMAVKANDGIAEAILLAHWYAVHGRRFRDE